MEGLVEAGFRLLSGAGTGPLLGAGVTVGLSGFVMFTLRYSVGLPLSVSALVVPFVVGAGFLIALALELFFAMPLLHAAALMTVPLVGLALLYEHQYGDPH
jgi:hypothetical protein